MTTQHGDHRVQQGFAAAGTIGAGALLLVGGILGLLQGISAVAKDDVFVAGPEYVYKLSLTGWGWIHIIVSLVAIAIAIGLFTGATWSRVAAIIIASLSIIVNFLWLPYYPWWSILVIAIDIVIIWAVSTWKTA
ncbi:DUF7144 family membrane protein [Gordonia insulae]|uniref:DUF7144 domain-containing protein n=1 Tax=Gordonia insulae TaxID=2420509 RepID=A0A3G8JR93_9ACTN|nr:hypothetical protein [Gordonia insulae]AZG47416.1 hypothetical protein D7316_04026 [Gordonia insulae]